MIMNKITSTCLLAAVLVLGGLVPLRAQTSPQDQQKAMEAYMKAGAVTENHAFLKRFAGSWQAETTMWAFPGQPPTTSQNPFEGKMILGGRFVSLSYNGTMMGQPFEGFQIIGYDNLQKKFITLWIDNSSTAFFLLAGPREADKEVINQKGELPDPTTGGMSKVRAVVTFSGPDSYVFEQFMGLPDGKEFKSMEMRCTRKK
jgi:hypothetical protein